MADEPQTPTSGRYSLRTRTPAKASQTPAPVVSTPTPRKRARTTGSARKGRGGSTNGRGRGRGGSSGARERAAPKVESPSELSMSSGEEDEDEEVEDFDPKRRHPDATYKADESSDDDEPSHGVEHPVRRGPGRPRKQAHEGPATPARRSWEVRRIPVHLTKHDAFRAESLDACAHILNAIPVEELSSGERYEQMKMSDALKMCGYELGASTSGTEPVQEVYRLLSWAVHAAGPNGAVHEAPVLSDAGRTVLLRVFAAMGSRIREETRDMAGYHRRHALRKLILAESEAPAADEDDAPVSPRGAAHRRNPLRIPGPLIDIWKEPYKKSADARNSAEHESQASDA